MVDLIAEVWGWVSMVEVLQVLWQHFVWPDMMAVGRAAWWLLVGSVVGWGGVAVVYCPLVWVMSRGSKGNQ